MKNPVKYDYVNAWVKSNNPCQNKKYSRRDEDSNGHIFADCFFNYARYNVTSKTWYVWNGYKWTEDTGAVIVARFAVMLYEALYKYAIDKDEDYKKHICKLGNLNNRKRMLEDAQKYNFICHEDLDSHKELLNLRNGIFNTHTLELIPHNPKYLLSKCANVEFHPDAICPVFMKALGQIMEEDNKKTRYLNKVLSLGLISDTREEECYIHYGKSTRNGKSTVLETVGHLLGDYSSCISPESLASKNKDSRTASPDIAKLKGVRFLRCSEPPKRMILDTALLKTMTGRDSISARQLYEREFEFIPEFALNINTNYLPVITDDTVFSSDRIKVISYNRHFEESEQDKGLKDKLLTELSGIFNWLLAGLRMYYSEGLIPPDSVIEDTKEYRANSDKIYMFWSEMLIEDPDSVIQAKDIFDTYNEWCKQNNFGLESKKTFFEELRQRGYLCPLGTIDGRSVRNIVKGFRLDFASNYDESENPFI